MPAAKWPVFDGHNDTLLRLYEDESVDVTAFLQRREEGHLDLPRARDSGWAGGIFAIFVPNPDDDGEMELTRHDDGSWEVAPIDPITESHAVTVTNAVIDDLRLLERAAEGAVKMVRSTNEIRECMDNDQMAVVLHFEGAEAIDTDLKRLDEYYDAGLRSLGIVWSRQNAFGYGVPFKYPQSPDAGPGLSDAGKALVRRCNERGINLDLSHLNAPGFRDVAEISNAPLVASHSASHTLSSTARNLLDWQIDAIGASGGLIGVNFYIGDLRPDGRGEPDAPLSLLVDHVDYIVNRIGIDHVAFGSDFDGATMCDEMKDVTGVPKAVALLNERGYGDAELKKIAHENWLRVLGRAWHEGE